MIPPSKVHMAKIVGRPTILSLARVRRAGCGGLARAWRAGAGSAGRRGRGGHNGTFGKKRSFCATNEHVTSSLKSARPVPAAREAGPGRHGGAPGPVANERPPVDQHATSRNPAEP